MGITVAAALAVLAVAVLRPDLRPAALPSASSFSRSWDPAADFRVGQAATNPAPDGYGHPAVWSYRFARPGVPTPGDYPLLTAFDFSAQAWVTPGAGSAVSLADGRLVLRPAGAVEGPAVIVSWASPVSAQIAIRGSFAVTSSGCDGDVALSIERGAVSHWLATIKPGSTAPFDITTSVVPGVPINFVVRGLGDRVCEAAALNARILELAGP